MYLYIKLSCNLWLSQNTKVARKYFYWFLLPAKNRITYSSLFWRQNQLLYTFYFVGDVRAHSSAFDTNLLAKCRSKEQKRENIKFLTYGDWELDSDFVCRYNYQIHALLHNKRSSIGDTKSARIKKNVYFPVKQWGRKREKKNSWSLALKKHELPWRMDIKVS